MTRPLTIEQMQEVAATHGGRCLSTRYGNSITPLEWECARGHRWLALPTNVTRGSWCRACAVQLRRTPLAEIQRKAGARGGRCLSTEYVNAHTPLLFECAAGHRWTTTYTYVREGSWCPACFHNRHRGTIEEMRALAASHGGECLSQTYEDQMQPLRWRCAAGHEWESTAHTTKQHWCKRCYHERRRHGIEKMREVAASRGGRCLSDEYRSAKHPLEWQCRLGHIWSTKPLLVLRGCWCPLCANLERSKKPVKRLKYDYEGSP